MTVLTRPPAAPAPSTRTPVPADVREYDKHRAPGEPLEFVRYIFPEEQKRQQQERGERARREREAQEAEAAARRQRERRERHRRSRRAGLAYRSNGGERRGGRKWDRSGVRV